MQTKLTLRIDDELIERAKSYSQRTGKSVSQLVSDYIKMLPESGREPGAKKGEALLTPIVRSLKGSLRGAKIDEEDYRRHLLEAALALGFDDFEDGVLHEAARQIDAHAIVTRNVGDFEQADLPVYTPEELVEILDLQAG